MAAEERKRRIHLFIFPIYFSVFAIYFFSLPLPLSFTRIKQTLSAGLSGTAIHGKEVRG